MVRRWLERARLRALFILVLFLFCLGFTYIISSLSARPGPPVMSYVHHSGSLFKEARFCAYASVMACSAVVLGLVANFASKFLPHIHRDFLIFALIVSAVTIVILCVILLRSQPRWDLFVLFLLAAGWLTMGSWSSDMIAHIECESLAGQTTPTKNGTMSSQVYCREMKAILAFSWANFVILVLSWAILLTLVMRVLSFGRQRAWEESISDIPWFNQMNYQQGSYAMYPYGYMGGQQVVQQVPGHTVVVGSQDGRTTVQQVPIR